jgi:hypothetical protein
MSIQAQIANPAHVEAERELRGYLAKFFFKRTASELSPQEKRVVMRCAGSIHGPVCMFAYRLPRQGGKLSDKLAPGKVVRSIERLARTVKSSGRTWENAWNALTPAAWYALVDAQRGRPMPLYASVPPTDAIAPIIPAALELARSNSRAMPFRDHAVVSIVQAYWYATHNSPTPKRVRALIEGVGRLYARHGLLPVQGLGAISSVKTLHRLIEQGTSQ